MPGRPRTLTGRTGATRGTSAAPHVTRERGLDGGGHRALARDVGVHRQGHGLQARFARTGPADSPERCRAEERLASGKSVLAALTAVLRIGDASPEADTSPAGDAAATLPAAVGDAVAQSEAVRLRRDIEDAAFDTVWRGQDHTRERRRPSQVARLADAVLQDELHAAPPESAAPSRVAGSRRRAHRCLAGDHRPRDERRRQAGYTLLIGLIEPFVGLGRPGVLGVAIRRLPSRGVRRFAARHPTTTRPPIRKCEQVAA